MVLVADVREGLPSPSEAVSDSRITGFIDAWSSRIALEVGSTWTAHPLAQEAIRLGATSAAYRMLFAQSGREESPDARDMRIQAEALIKSLDEATSASDESGAVYEGLVSNVSDSPLWTASDFGIT